MRNASTSPSKRAPNALTVPVRRATRPSTASSASAAAASATSSAESARIDRERGDAGGERRPRQRHPRRGPERAGGHPSPNRGESA